MKKRINYLINLEKRIITIDAHSHACGINMYAFQHTNTHMVQNMSDLSKKMKEQEIDYFIVFPMPSAIYFDTRTFKKSGLEDWPYQLNNKALIYETELSGAHALPFLIVHPTEKIDLQIAYLETLAQSYSIFGLKFHPISCHQKTNSLNNSAFLEFMRKYNLPMTVHSGCNDEYSNPNQIFPILERNPDLTFCIAHSGDFDTQFITRAKEFRNLFIDCSPFDAMCAKFSKLNNLDGKLRLNLDVPFEALQQLYDLIPEQLMWGSDEPWTKLMDSMGRIQVETSLSQAKNTLDSIPSDIKKQISYYNTLRYLQANLTIKNDPSV